MYQLRYFLYIQTKRVSPELGESTSNLYASPVLRVSFPRYMYPLIPAVKSGRNSSNFAKGLIKSPSDSAQIFLRSVVKINNSADIVNSPDVSDCFSVDIVKL